MQIIKKIENKSAIVGVIGLGYVGLPMAVTVARKGFRVIGVDVSKYAVNHVNAGQNYIGDVDDDELKEMVENGRLSATFDYGEMRKADIIMIAVPTPLDKYQQPDSSFVQASVDSLAENVSKDTLVILESTTYPGTTEEILAPAFQNKGFKIGEDIYVAFSPERVDPGNKSYKTNNTPKVVGGITEKCNRISEIFYKAILDAPIHLVSSPAVAEMEKIYENTFRNINIALANEMTILCERMGLDVWEVIEAAKTKPYGFMAFYPGPGIGGHCIPLDPFYLTWKAREYGYHTRLIELAGEINNAMPSFVIAKLTNILNEKGKALSQAKILLLGAAYKKDIEDMRESPVQDLIVILEKKFAKFDYNDPHVPEFHNELNDTQYQSVDLDKIEEYDAVIIVTDHTSYDYKDILKRAKLVLDTRHACNGLKAENLYRM
ncbi:MAG: nucleotide sugar dehydrogenase [Candidatus Cloacimonetes bacterium]|nr:nucleotide sugar dehydrogenase [Candidatus Cloacimonadota bacterium]MCF7815078.1 nucleotide sugar dehydrogenase [Candidatus Cloacimonadota bacterium]MCF7868559.1 nucleotide sugar dehydrogenase [Candidatus Cloacimonadota bacterium]MCF7884271.1 nucleotide sugar dehydrogenase [Candidatus Cloacimonadota bacterium]